MAELPSEYMELPCIISDGTNYIDTGYVPPNAGTPSIYATITDYANANTNKVVFGIKDTSNDTYTSFSVTSGPDSSTTGSVTMINAGNTIEWLGLINTSTTYEIIWYNDEVYMHNIERGSQSYAGRPGQLFQESTGVYIATTQPLYIFALNNDGIATDMFKGKLYRFKIENSSTGTVRDYVPCMRVSDKKIGVYDLITGTFLTNAAGNDFKTVGSLAVNYNSFVNTLVSRCKYLDNTLLSDIDKSKVLTWLKSYDGTVNGSRLINVGDAKRIIRRLGYAISTTGGVDSFALSSNMALSLLNAIPKYNLFSTLGNIFTNDLNEYNYNNPAIVLVEDIETFGGTLVGGGGGGSGGVSGDNGKKNVTTKGGSGWAGEESRFSYRLPDGTSGLIEAAGGAGAGVNSYYHEGNAPYRRDGTKGTDGARETISLSLPSRTVIAFVNGNGGSGGGGCSTKIDWDGTVSAGNATADAGGNAGGNNSWSGEDWVHAGGGGSGGWNGTGTQDTPGAMYHKGPSHGRDANGEYGTNGVGGRGGYCDTTQGAQPTTIGAGGYGGYSYVYDDQKCDSGGGNGGNVGGFIVDDATKDYLVLYEQEGASIELYY